MYKILTRISHSAKISGLRGHVGQGSKHTIQFGKCIVDKEQKIHVNAHRAILWGHSSDKNILTFKLIGYLKSAFKCKSKTIAERRLRAGEKKRSKITFHSSQKSKIFFFILFIFCGEKKLFFRRAAIICRFIFCVIKLSSRSIYNFQESNRQD